MTQKEKAKAYDELFAKAKQIYNKENDVLIMHTIEDLFPELAESEDEKIRKWIINEIKIKHHNLDEDNVDFVDKAIAWLENIPYTIDHEKREGFHLGYKAALEKQGESYTKKDVDDAYVEGMAFAKNELEKQGEQKETLCDKCKKAQPSHSCQDITALGRCYIENINTSNKVEPKFKVKYAGSEYNVLEIKEIAGVTYYGIEDEPNHIDYVLSDNCEIIGGYGIKGNGCSFPTKPTIFSEKKPKRMVSAEAKEAMYDKPACAWSEEDDDAAWMNDIISKVENNLQLNKAEIDWLKSLKERITWKPSEEQMDALNSARWNAPFKIEILDSLYNDLKKLTE